jgi:hypothetical protein
MKKYQWLSLLNAVDLGSVSAKAIALGRAAQYTCVLSSDGKVRCFGQTAYNISGTLNVLDVLGAQYPALTQYNYGNQSGQMGTGLSPTSMVSGTINQIVAGGSHTCVLAGTSIRCWGDNSYGELGQSACGTSFTVTTPPKGGYCGDGGNATNLSVANATQIAAGAFHTCVATYNAGSNLNAVSCWGASVNGANGGSSNTNSVPATPTYDGTH